MDRTEFGKAVDSAASERGCRVVEISFNDDDNVFEVVLARDGGAVDLADCEYVHRALLDRFDRNIEDYALTVASQGISAEEADELLGGMDE